MRYVRPALVLVLFLVLLMPALHARAQDDVTVTHALAMTGAPKYPAGFTHFEYVNPDAPKGGRVKLSVLGTFDSFNPFIVKGVPAAGIATMYETLTTQSLDEPFTQYGLIADKIEIPKDRSWVIYHIDPRARFHDGKPVTAEDVVFSFNLLVTKGNPAYQRYWADVKKVEALDERRVRFDLGEKPNPELALILGQVYVLPKHYWETRDFTNTGLSEVPLGSGPYKVLDFKPGRSISYERVQDYWGRDLPVNKGQYNFDVIVYDYYRDSTVALQAFKSGEFDWNRESVAKSWATQYEGPPFNDGFIVKEEVDHDVNMGMQCFVFNTRRFLFQDKRVREALAYAFDFEWTNKNIFFGKYKRSASFFSNSELASSGLPTPAELKILEPFRDQLLPEVLTKEYQPPKSDGSGNIRGNLRQAVRLLKQAGWEIRNKKLTHVETGRVFEFELMLSQPTFERIALPFKKNLARLGIEMNVRVVDTSQYFNRLREYDFDMFINVYGQSESPGNEQRYFWGSEAADVPGAQNYAGIKDPAIDRLIEMVISAPDRQALVDRTRALDRVLLWGHYVIPQWHSSSYFVAYWNKFSKPAINPKYAIGFNAWWVDLEREKRVDQYRARLKKD